MDLRRSHAVGVEVAGNADGSGYWSFNQGFLYIISNVLGYGTPLTNVTPTNWIAQGIAPVTSFAEDYFRLNALHWAPCTVRYGPGSSFLCGSALRCS